MDTRCDSVDCTLGYIAQRGIEVMAFIHGMQYDGPKLAYCPWCGRKPFDELKPVDSHIQESEVIHVNRKCIIMVGNTKRCGSCNLEKPLDDFSFNKRMIDERERTCRSCRAVFRHTRRAKKRLGTFGGRTSRDDVFSAFGSSCLCCGKSTNMTVDHVVPIALYGTNEISNLQPLCSSCNSKKGVKIIDYR